MSESKQIKLIGQILKELVQKLDNKFETIERVQTQIEHLETQLDNFRAYTERNNVQINQELQQLVTIVQSSLQHTNSATSFKPVNFSPKNLEKVKLTPTKQIKSQKTRLPSLKPTITGTKKKSTSRILKTKKTKSPKSGIFSSMKETPLVSASKVLEKMSDGDGDYHKVVETRKSTRKKSLRGYMEKLENVCHQVWLVADHSYDDKDFDTFIDKGLTVLHGIIEFLFVGFRNEFPNPQLDYNSKARNLSGLGLFKDNSLLNKMEEATDQLKRGKSAGLATPVIRGWHERLTRIYEKDFKEKIEDAYMKVR